MYARRARYDRCHGSLEMAPETPMVVPNLPTSTPACLEWIMKSSALIKKTLKRSRVPGGAEFVRSNYYRPIAVLSDG